MPKHLVTALGLIVSLGVIALGVFLVAVPLYFQSVAVDVQTITVANSNAIYQAQVDTLRAQEEELDAINASVDGLRDQLPATGQLDDVFEVVARAAEASGVTLTVVTAGEQVAFVAHTGEAEGEAAAAPAVAPTPAPTVEGADAATGTATEATDAAAGDAADPSTGRQQVDFVIQATAADMGQATAFLDALRAGPRLLSNVSALANQIGASGFDLQITALTYIDEEG